MSAGVMMAKVIWKVMNTDSGMVPERASTVTPARKQLVQTADPLIERAAIRSRPDCNRRSPREGSSDPVMAKHCMSTESTFLERTKPA